VPLTGYLTFGPISVEGSVTVALTFDHRVMDGRHAARALLDMEHVLNTVLVDELRSLGTAQRPFVRAKGTHINRDHTVAMTHERATS
jgi:hypothetical protein